MNMNSTLRWTALVGGALLLAAIAAAVFMRASTQTAEHEKPVDAPTAAQKETTPVDAPDEPVSKSTESGESGSNADLKTAEFSFRYSADRWIEIVRSQISPHKRNDESVVQRLEMMRKDLEKLPPEERDEYVRNFSRFYVWRWKPHLSARENLIRKAIFEEYGTFNPQGKTPRRVIEILVEGLDDLTAARHLANPPDGWGWKREREYALEYANRALENDPSSREALILKRSLPGANDADVARQLIKYHPKDEEALWYASLALDYNHPEETIAALAPYLDQAKGAVGDVHGSLHNSLGVSYERLGLYAEALDQYLLAKEAGFVPLGGNIIRLERGEPYQLIWEARAAWEAHAAAAAESAQEPAPPSETPETPQRQSDAPKPPDAPEPDDPRPEGSPPAPPPGAETDMAAAYADFAKAYQEVFEMEYGLSEATPEGYMNALLGMARAFARAGDAQHAQDAYNAVRKRHSLEEVQQAFRRFDEQERLKRQPPSDEENDDSEEE